MIKFKIHF